MESPLGLIAGNGQFPAEFIRAAHKKGRKVVVVGHRGETDPAIEALADTYIWVRLGQLGKIIKFLKRSGCKEVSFVGGIKRVNFLGGVIPDWKGAKLLAQIVSRRDDAVLRAVARFLEDEGFNVIGPHSVLDSSVPMQLGALTRRALTPHEMRDMELGIEIAKIIGRLDIGQTVVIYDGLVIAIETIEGTDATLLRAGELLKGRGGVVVKLCKETQDERLDMPAIGPETIATMRKSGLSALVCSVGKTVILDPASVVAAADHAAIAIEIS